MHTTFSTTLQKKIEMNRLSLIVVAALPMASAFAPIAPSTSITINKAAFTAAPLFSETGTSEESAASESVFIAPDESKTDEDVSFAKAESLGRGAAKVRFLGYRAFFSEEIS